VLLVSGDQCDKGVDGTLEIKIDDHFTNLRSQIQLKSTESITANQDGSVSLSIETSNFNYLLNGPSPLYVLSAARTKWFDSWYDRWRWSLPEKM
jgi:hypothetical protein